jgi:hypothetical protein
MEHAINRCSGANEDDLSLSVTALVVVLGLFFTLYFALRMAVPDLPLHVYNALADLPWASEQAHFLHDEPIATAQAVSNIPPSATSGVPR